MFIFHFVFCFVCFVISMLLFVLFVSVMIVLGVAFCVLLWYGCCAVFFWLLLA